MAIENGSDSEGLVKYKWGFIDKTGEVVVGKTKNKHVGKFEDADDFSEGLAAVKMGKKWGYIDTKDQIVIPYQFHEAKGFSESLAPATIDGQKWGFIDRTGHFVITPTFTAAEGFSEGLAAISTYMHGWNDWGFIDKSGKVVIEPTFYRADNFHEGLVRLFWGGDRGLGFGDRTRNVVIDGKFRAASDFENGVAWVYPSDYGEKYILYGGAYIDKTGRYLWNAKEENITSGSKCNN